MSNFPTYCKHCNSRPLQQKVLLFQGGGALEPNEAGIYKSLYEGLKWEVKENRPLFDIVAGTSAGAINATLIVNHVLQNKDEEDPWKGSDETLYRFWQEVSIDTPQYENPFLQGWLHASSKLR